jgi:hypothetical protein
MGVDMDKCPCLDFDENDNCTECGKPMELPDLGDLVGICGLIDSTAADCSKSPLSLRLRKMIRSHKEAKALGYRGDILRWIEFVQERMLSAS